MIWWIDYFRNMHSASRAGMKFCLTIARDEILIELKTIHFF